MPAIQKSLTIKPINPRGHYEIVKSVNTLTPSIGACVTEREVQALINKHVRVTITPADPII